MIRAVILDADGVVINGERSKTAFARDLGITPEMTDNYFRGAFRDCLVGKADLKETLAPHLPNWGWQAGVDAFLAYWFRVEHSLDEQLLSEVASLRSKSIPCYLATNQERYRTAYISYAMGLGGRFDGIFSSAYVGHLKDTSAFWEHVTAALRPIPAEELLFWDDSQANVDAARGTGVQGELYSGISGFRDRMGRRTSA